MKPLKTARIILFAGILLLVSGILLGKSAYAKVLELNGQHGMEKVVVKYDNRIAAQKKVPFGIRDIEAVRNALDGADLTYTASVKDSVAANEKSAESEIVGTNSLFPLFGRIHIIRGSFFPQKADEMTDAVAVIDERLAVKLFNSTDVIGNKFEAAGKSFTVTGVFSYEESVVRKLVDNGIPSVYVPASLLFELYKEISITQFEVASPYGNTMGKNAEAVSKAIQTAGKNPADYKITDCNISNALLAEKSGFALFLAFLAVILAFLKYVKKQAEPFIAEIREERKNNYVKNLLFKKLPEIAVFILKAVFIALSAVMIWSFAKFSPYIPPEYIPADLTDIGYFADLIGNNIEKGNLAAGYTAPVSVQIINAADTILNFLFCVNLLPGALLFYIGISKMRRLKQGQAGLAGISGIFIIISLAITAVICGVTGLEPCFDLRILAIVWVFIFLNVLNITQEGEVEINA